MVDCQKMWSRLQTDEWFGVVDVMEAEGVIDGVDAVRLKVARAAVTLEGRSWLQKLGDGDAVYNVMDLWVGDATESLWRKIGFGWRDRVAGLKTKDVVLVRLDVDATVFCDLHARDFWYWARSEAKAMAVASNVEAAAAAAAAAAK